MRASEIWDFEVPKRQNPWKKSRAALPRRIDLPAKITILAVRDRKKQRPFQNDVLNIQVCELQLDQVTKTQEFFQDLESTSPRYKTVHFLTAWQRASQVVHKREESARPMQFYLGRRFGPMQPFPIIHRTSQDNTGQHSSGPRITARPVPATRSGQQARRMIPESTASPHPCIARAMLI